MIECKHVKTSALKNRSRNAGRDPDDFFIEDTRFPLVVTMATEPDGPFFPRHRSSFINEPLKGDVNIFVNSHYPCSLRAERGELRRVFMVYIMNGIDWRLAEQKNGGRSIQLSLHYLWGCVNCAR